MSSVTDSIASRIADAYKTEGPRANDPAYPDVVGGQDVDGANLTANDGAVRGLADMLAGKTSGQEIFDAITNEHLLKGLSNGADTELAMDIARMVDPGWAPKRPEPAPKPDPDEPIPAGDVLGGQQ